MVYQSGLDDLAPASFRGVPFFVQSDKEEYARRIATHEFPQRDDPYFEDFGQRYQEFSVTGYVASGTSKLDKEAIVAACLAPGAGFLQLPAKIGFLARCLSCNVTRSLDKQGYFDVTLTFRRDEPSASFATPVPVFEQLIATAATAAIGVFTLVYDVSFNAFGVLPYVVANLTAILQDFSDVVVTTAENTPLIGSSAETAALIRDALGLYSSAPRYVQPLGYGTFNTGGVVVRYNGYATLTGNPAAVAPTVGSVLNSGYGPSEGLASGGSGSTFASGDYSPTVPLTNPGASAVVAVIAGMLDDLYSLLAPADAVEVMQGLSGFSSGETLAVAAPLNPDGSSIIDNGNAPSPSDVANQANAALVNGTIRAFALMQYGRAVAATDYLTRQDAVQARADVVELFNATIDVAPDENTAVALTQVRDLAVRSLTARLTSLADKIEVNASSSMPSLFWAYRLYGDAERAQELIDRNDVPAPAFMPHIFEALVS